MVSSPALVAVRALASRVDSSHWLCVFLSFLVSLTTTGTTDGTTTDNNSQDTTAKDKDTATSEDEQTPKSLVDLDDEDTPKGNIDAKDKTSKTPIVAGIGIIVVSVAALVGLIVFLKKRAK